MRILIHRAAPALIAALLVLGACSSGTGDAAGAAQGSSKSAATPSSSDPAEGLWPPAQGYDVLFTDAGGDRYSGQIYNSPDFKQLLIVPNAGNTLFVLTLGARTLAVLPAKSVQVRGAGARVADDPPPAASGSFDVNGAEIRFRYQKIDALIGPQDPLVGEVPLDVLLARKLDYVAAMKAYDPDRAVVTALRNVQKPVQLMIFFGTWCGVCKERLPGLLRTLEDAGNPRISLKFISVAEEYKEPRDLITKYGVHITPTVIVMDQGREVARLNKKPQPTLEADLARVLGGL